MKILDWNENLNVLISAGGPWDGGWSGGWEPRSGKSKGETIISELNQGKCENTSIYNKEHRVTQNSRTLNNLASSLFKHSIMDQQK